MDIYNEWINDLPQQFQGKQNIGHLIRTFSKQMQEIYDVFGQLKNETDLDTAIGKNLDVVGDIVNLSRKDAHIILRKAKDTEITDEIYRRVLKYKSIQNSCDCTYYDMMYSISLLWNTDNISYLEPPDRPATVLLKINKTSLDSIDPAIGRVLAIKPAGVSVVYTIEYWEKIFLLEYKKITLERAKIYWNFPLLKEIQLFYRNAILKFQVKEQEKIVTRNKYLFVTKIENEFSIFTIKNKVEVVEKTTAETKIKITSKVESKNDISCMLISKRNIWYLDGTYMLDGSRYLNAEEIREVI